MPDYSTFPVPQGDWLRFVESLRLLLGPQPDDRPLDQFLQFRDAVLEFVSSPDFLTGLQAGWPPAAPMNQTALTSVQQQQIANILLLELRAFPAAVEVAHAQEKSGSEDKGWFRKQIGRLIGRASTGTGSMKDLLDNLPPHVKMGLTALKQVLDVFKVDFF
jgi:hypothetical protein